MSVRPQDRDGARPRYLRQRSKLDHARQLDALWLSTYGVSTPRDSRRCCVAEASASGSAPSIRTSSATRARSRSHSTGTAPGRALGIRAMPRYWDGLPGCPANRSRRFVDHADTTVIVELEPAVAPKGSRCWLAMSARTSITGPPRRLPPITGNRRLRPVHASTHRALNAPTPRCSAAAKPSAFTRRVSMGGSTIDRSRVAMVASRPPYNPTSSYLMTANGQAACSHSATVVRSTASSSARSARTHERTCASWAPPSSG